MSALKRGRLSALLLIWQQLILKILKWAMWKLKQAESPEPSERGSPTLTSPPDVESLDERVLKLVERGKGGYKTCET